MELLLCQFSLQQTCQIFSSVHHILKLDPHTVPHVSSRTIPIYRTVVLPFRLYFMLLARFTFPLFLSLEISITFCVLCGAFWGLQVLVRFASTCVDVALLAVQVLPPVLYICAVQMNNAVIGPGA